MDFISSIKDTAEQIINFTSSPNINAHKLKPLKSAPPNVLRERAGFEYYDQIFEILADIYVVEEENKSMLRARMAQTKMICQKPEKG